MRVAAVKSSTLNESSAQPQAEADFDRHVQNSKAAKDQPPHGNNTVTAKTGDTLWDIANDNGLSMKSLYQANPQFDPRREDGILHFDRSQRGGWDPDYIRPGDVIRLPAQAPNVPNTPGTGSRNGTPPTPPANNPTAGSAPAPTPTPNIPGVTPTPTNPNVTPTPTAPVATPTPSPTATSPSGSPNNANPPPVMPVPLAGFVPTKGGFGVENAWKLSSRPTIGAEPYGKVSWSLDKTPGRELDLNVKVKITPRAKATVTTFDPTGAQGTAEQKPSWLERVKNGVVPEKITVDAGLVFKKQVEGGGSIEIPWGKGKPTTSVYVSKKDAANILVDNAQLKLGKLSPGKLASAAARGTWESITQPKSSAQTDGRWQPLKTRMWDTLKGAEVTLSGEKAFLNPQGQVSGFGNGAAKVTLGEINKGMQPPANTPGGFTRFSGFAAGTAASFAGGELTDRMIGKYIPNQDVRKAVDGFGAGLAGVTTDAVVQKAAPALASKAAPVVSKVVAPVANAIAPLASKAAPLLSKAAPITAKAAPLLSKIAPIAAKAAPVLGKVARVGGPAGALLAGVPDGVKAYQEFKQGNTTEGWKSVGRGAVRVGATALGAAIGSLGGPLGTVAGAVVGGFIGDKLASLF